MGDQRGNVRVVEFADLAALAADQELADMGAVRVAAADEGIERFDLVDETVGEEEVERAVDRRRCRRAVILTQLVEYFIGADRRVPVPDDLEDAAAQLGKALTVLVAHPFRRLDRVGNAGPVIVAAMRKCRLRGVVCHGRTLRRLTGRMPRGIYFEIL